MISKSYLLIKRIILQVICFIVYFYIILFKKKNQTVLVFPYAIGDTCYALSYRSHFLKRNKCKFYFSEGCKSIIDSCYTDIINNADVVYYKKNKYIYIIIDLITRNYILYSFFSRFGIVVPFPNALFPTKEYSKFNYLSILKIKFVDYIPSNANIEFPVVPKCVIFPIEDFQNNKNRIVILNPFSNSMFGDERSLWENIANLLISSGFIVYTNVLKNQNEIKGTKRLECSVIELYNICNEIPLFVSLRSGIIDFTISTKCKKIIIWYMDTYLSKNLKNIYDINAWKVDNVSSIYHKSCSESFEEFKKLFRFILNN